MKRGPIAKPYWEMDTAELREATQDLDEAFVIRKTLPLTTKDRALLARARRKPGRPRIGKGAKRVLVTVERGMLKRIDAEAKKAGLSRSAFLLAGAKAIMKNAG